MVTLKIPPKEAVLLLNERIVALETIREKPGGLGYYDVVGWLSQTWPVIDRIYGAGDIHSEELRMMGLPGCSCNPHQVAQLLAEMYGTRLLEYIHEIREVLQTPER
jgi:hypothetical protein